MAAPGTRIYATLFDIHSTSLNHQAHLPRTIFLWADSSSEGRKSMVLFLVVKNRSITAMVLKKVEKAHAPQFRSRFRQWWRYHGEIGAVLPANVILPFPIEVRIAQLAGKHLVGLAKARNSHERVLPSRMALIVFLPARQHSKPNGG